MILSAIKARLMPIAYTAIGLMILAMAGVIYWLYRDNQALAGEAEKLEQANSQLAESARNQAAENAQLNSELKRRDRIAVESARIRQREAAQARRQQEGINDALKDNDCAAQPHPAAVGDWLRKNSDDL